MIKFRNLFLFSKSEISQAFKDAKFIAQEDGLKILKSSENQDFGKLLIIIPKMYGKANKRNLLRRRIKAIYYQKKLYENKHIFIIIASKLAQNLDFESLKKTLKKYLLSNETNKNIS